MNASNYFIQATLSDGYHRSYHKAVNCRSAELVTLLKVRGSSSTSIGVGGDDEHPKQLRRELKTLEKLRGATSNDCVVRYFGHFDDAGSTYVVFDYCAIGPVTNLLTMSGGHAGVFNEAQVSFVCHQVALALRFLHSRQVVHRNVKPSSFLVDTSGRVLLGNYGTASVMNANDDDADTYSQQQQLSIAGSPLYLAPELLRDEGPPAPAPSMDIWSLGISALAMRDGEAPYQRLPTLKALCLIRNQPPPVAVHQRDCSALFNNFVAALLRREPDARPTADAVLQAPFAKLGTVSNLRPLVESALQCISQHSSHAAATKALAARARRIGSDGKSESAAASVGSASRRQQHSGSEDGADVADGNASVGSGGGGGGGVVFVGIGAKYGDSPSAERKCGASDDGGSPSRQRRNSSRSRNSSMSSHDDRGFFARVFRRKSHGDFDTVLSSSSSPPSSSSSSFSASTPPDDRK